jgi:hypothetical protein
VNYGIDTTYGSNAVDSNTALGTTHSVTLNGLTAGTEYHFDVISTDVSSNNSIPVDQVLTTESVNNNAPPVATDDSYTTSVDLALAVNITNGVLANDSDSDLDSITALLVDNVSNGILTLNGDGSFDYTPNTGYSGTDSFTYQANDSLINSNLATVTITVDNSTGFCGKALKFDGANDWVNIPDLSFSGDFSIEAWVYLEPGIDNKDGLVGQEGTGQDINFYQGKVHLWGPTDVLIANTAMNASTWNHIAITRSSGNLTTYLNGVEDGTGVWAGVFAPKAIGRTNKGFLNGRLDEVRIWDIARNSTEIVANYNKGVAVNSVGLVAYWTFNDDSNAQQVLDSSSSANSAFKGLDVNINSDDPVQINSSTLLNEDCAIGSINVAPSTQAGTDQTIILPGDATLSGTVSDDGLPTPPGTVTTLWTVISGPGTVTFTDATQLDTTASFNLEGTYVLDLTADDRELTSNDQLTITVNAAPTGSDDLLAHWPLNEGTGASAGDISGHGHNGTLTNGPVWNGTELIFDGVNDYVNLGTLDISGSALTLTGWVQADDLGNCGFYMDCRILSKATGTSEQDHYWMVSTIKVGSATRLRFRLKAGGTTSTLIASSGNLVNGELFHAAASYDGSTMRLYKDGVEVGSRAKTGAIDTNNTVEAWAGASPTVASRPWKGLIADIRVYQKTLTVGELNTVKESYNNGGGGSNNVAPSVQAGTDQTLILPSDATLSGTVSDDGLPTPPGSVTTLWTVISGPGTVTFTDATQLGTTASFSLDGTYVLDLTADDSELTSNDQLTIIVNAEGAVNTVPTVDAGSDQTITLPSDVTLSGTVSDDGLPTPPGTVTTLWTVISGPGTVTFADATQLDTTASFNLEGTYVLDLTADDSELTSNDQLTITVNAALTGSNDLLAHWPLNEGAGTSAGDISGYGHNGTLTNGPVWNGTELIFDGVNDYVNLGTLDISGSALTLAGWVQVTDLANCTYHDCRILSKATGTSEQDHYWMISTTKVGSATRLRFRLKAGGLTSTLIATSGDISNGDSFHFAASYDGSTMRLYKDGIEIGNLTKTGAIDTNSTVEAWIGGNPTVGNSRPWDGSLTNVRIYQKSLTLTDVITIMGADEVADVTAPIISNKQVTTTSSSATITWNTNEAADSNVSYGTSNAYENGTVNDGSSVISHSVTLSGLVEATTYHYQLESTDRSSNTAISIDLTFVTGAVGDEPELLMFDWNTVVQKSHRGFPKDYPPRVSANGDWTGLINYVDGTLYLRAKIKSGGQPVPKTMRLNFCAWQKDLVTGAGFGLEACVPLSQPLVGIAGNELTWSVKISDLVQISDDPLDWTRVRRAYGIAIKNTAGVPVTDFFDPNWSGENPDEWYPLDLRFTVVVVPNGQTFSGWNNYIN